jgi:hypothetical protein
MRPSRTPTIITPRTYRAAITTRSPPTPLAPLLISIDRASKQLGAEVWHLAEDRRPSLPRLSTDAVVFFWTSRRAGGEAIASKVGGGVEFEHGLIPEEAPAAPSFLFWLERETPREPHMTTV